MLQIAENHPANLKVLASLASQATRQGKELGPIAPADSVKDPYMNCGSHPDAVERVWDQLGGALPESARCLVFGNPALVHPKSGVILAISSGTAYYVRLPRDVVRPPPRPRIEGDPFPPEWFGEIRFTDEVRQFGEDWAIGRWLPDELKACLEVYQKFDIAPPKTH
jgi:hypothetical protein